MKKTWTLTGWEYRVGKLISLLESFTPEEQAYFRTVNRETLDRLQVLLFGAEDKTGDN